VAAVDLDLLWSIEPNASALEVLRAWSVPRTKRNSSIWDLDDFELHTHPDLSERLEACATSLPEASIRGVYGFAALVHPNAVLYAVATGMSDLQLRLATDDPDRPSILALKGSESPFGSEWVTAAAWLTDVPRADGTAMLTAWVRRAFGTATEAVGRDA
jgi:hypothetical protein